MHKELANNITHYVGISDRLAYIVIKPSNKQTLKVTQVYAKQSRIKVAQFYKDLSECHSKKQSTYTLSLVT